MKIKGISVFEQHVEKIVLGLVVVIAVLFAAMQFLGRGNTIEIEGREYTASQVDEALEEKAQDIQERLREEAPPTIATPARPRVFEWFERTRRAGVTPPDQYLASIPARASGLASDVTTVATDLFVEPVLAGITQPRIQQHSDAIEPETLELLPPSIQESLTAGPTGSYDITWATVSAVLDVKALREQIAAEDPAGERLPIPANWYGGRIDVVDLLLVREELVGDEWGNQVVLDPIFQTMSDHRERINRTGDDRISAGERNRLLDWLREPPGRNQALIIQPTFHVTKGSAWTQPVMPGAEAENAQEAEVLMLQARLAALDKQLSDLERELEELGGPPPETPRGGRDEERRPPGGGSGGGQGPGIPGGGGAGGGGSGGDIGGEQSGGRGGGASGEQNLVRRRTLARTIQNYSQRRDRLAGELEEKAQLAGIDLNAQEQPEVFPNLLTDDQVLVWAHDMTAESGKTYRYRIQVLAANPFYAKESFLIEEQQGLAKMVGIPVEASEWTDPVRIKSNTRFFVTSAQPDDGAFNAGRVKLELYRLIDGQWHRKVLDLQPGDPIVDSVEVRGADEQMHRVEFQTGAYVLDVIRNPRETSSIGTTAAGKAVIAMPDGTTILRTPEQDQNNPERLALEASARAVEQGSPTAP